MKKLKKVFKLRCRRCGTLPQIVKFSEVQGTLSAMTAQLDAAAEIQPSRPWGKPLHIVG